LVRDTAEAEAIEEGFVDVAAFIESIEPPAFPNSIDAALAETGEQVFLDTCATCHGTYGEDWTYPNVIIP
jgi:mono/diheme cytochrome c family protein